MQLSLLRMRKPAVSAAATAQQYTAVVLLSVDAQVSSGGLQEQHTCAAGMHSFLRMALLLKCVDNLGVCCLLLSMPVVHLQGLCVAEASDEGGVVLHDITNIVDLAGLNVSQE